jgi:hypothetical protein
VQVVAFVDDHVRLVDDPVVTDGGVAVNVTVGNTGAVTVTDALADPEPPVPEHVRVKLALAVSAAEFSLPLVAFAPVQPPEAVQDVALVLDQVSVDVFPDTTLTGLADSVTVGAGTGAGAELPPPPQAARTRDKTTGAAKRPMVSKRMGSIIDPIATLINVVILKPGTRARVCSGLRAPAPGCVYKPRPIGHNSCPQTTTISVLTTMIRGC